MARSSLPKVPIPPKRQTYLPFYSNLFSICDTSLSKTRIFFVGMLLTAMRIFRCQPFCVPGYDPVPERGLRNRRYEVAPMTKYFYPEEYGLERDENEEQ